ncbi:hypothetical protein FACS1894103_6530 [Campylobacterota bacterium]|nr:hypothetical protein FACS1894103_6530 [Campylobacterota bacterium]
MADTLREDALAALSDQGSFKILATLDENGAPHLTPKGSLRVEGNELLHWEILESSKTNRNLTRSIWFDKPVSALVLTPDRRAFRFELKPIRNVVSGKLFGKHYEEAAAKFNGRGIAGVWIYEILSVADQSAKTRIAEEAALHPYFKHLDQIAKQEQ